MGGIIKKVKKIIPNITKRILSRFAISFAVFALISVLLSGWLYPHMEFVEPGNLLFAQLQIVFVVITFVTLLSSKSQTIYWIDVVQYRLVKPKWYSVTDIVSYIFAALSINVISYVFSLRLGLFSFVITILLLSFLSIRLVSSYFDTESIKANLQNEYELAKDSEDKTKYERILANLYSNYMTAIQNTNINEAVEDVDFFINHKETSYIISCVNYACEYLPHVVSAYILRNDKMQDLLEDNFDFDTEFCNNLYNRFVIAVNNMQTLDAVDYIIFFLTNDYGKTHIDSTDEVEQHFATDAIEYAYRLSPEVFCALFETTNRTEIFESGIYKKIEGFLINVAKNNLSSSSNNRTFLFWYNQVFWGYIFFSAADYQHLLKSEVQIHYCKAVNNFLIDTIYQNENYQVVNSVINDFIKNMVQMLYTAMAKGEKELEMFSKKWINDFAGKLETLFNRLATDLIGGIIERKIYDELFSTIGKNIDIMYCLLILPYEKIRESKFDFVKDFRMVMYPELSDLDKKNVFDILEKNEADTTKIKSLINCIMLEYLNLSFLTAINDKTIDDVTYVIPLDPSVSGLLLAAEFEKHYEEYRNAYDSVT